MSFNKIIVLFLRKLPYLHEIKQNQKHPFIKRWLVKAPVLHMSNSEGRFHLYSDMSKFAAGSALYQIQNGKLRLIAYVCKRLLEAVGSYSITELALSV